MDIREIQNLIKFVAKSGATEVKLEMDDFKITIRTTAEGGSPETAYIQHVPVSQPVQQPVIPSAPSAPSAPAAPQTPAATGEDTSKYITIKSPIIGTLYRKPSPDKAPFVEVGSTISKGDVVCVIEAMKLFNEIESEVSGKIVKVLVDDASPVEFDQPLFLVDPS
ncbi:acetyl-CoA carboxylase, biotin carboxyl carrier protein [Flavobacterium cyanobacteriorum]|uniref:Biotin carboxyl carrier protein of acetyl-CoA carboxylase n=1 Tax=Flavobacterium cyanobacteriorum TaxID=2022802 RepID=A0A255ZR49_9FLAO|nr:acetyl-CoA carboxylase biotin carboxyl carrier protein [Flavobacterium cyanobacteriorum]OYQ43978.1 acetyl-CoA carboxylase, biotin carboxyl carrier protein [Flavobacterium cyanobacteriorum]